MGSSRLRSVGKPRWPTEQSDGTVAVAVRLVVVPPGTLGPVEQAISRWIDEKKAAGVKLELDLASLPTAEVIDQARIDVVFNSEADSRMWKDWMVDLTQRLSAISGVRVAGFEDRVTGAFRPHTDTD